MSYQKYIKKFLIEGGIDRGGGREGELERESRGEGGGKREGGRDIEIKRRGGGEIGWGGRERERAR